MEKQKLLVVLDPIPQGFSVQFDLLMSFSKKLSKNKEIFVYSNYIAKNKELILTSIGIHIIPPTQSWFSFLIKKYLYDKLNESLLWGVNWFLDVLNLKLGKNANVVFDHSFDLSINLSSTIMCKSDLMWIQGPPFVEVVESMSQSNILAKIIFKLFRRPLANGSRLLTLSMTKLSKQVAANSNFIASRYAGYPFSIDYVIHTNKEFTLFEPKKKKDKEKYVLTYIGKETDVDTLIKMSELKIKIIAFGAKVPPGFNLSKLEGKIKFLGRVSETELITLYSNALFVAFPFTNEPYGWVPIESMRCGTPVLSYAREGPSETIINGVTGWLVNNQDEFLKKAKMIWEQGSTNLDPNFCVARGKEFSIEQTISDLLSILEYNGHNEINSYS